MIYKNSVGVKKNFSYFLRTLRTTGRTFTLYSWQLIRIKKHRYFLGECNILSIFTKFFCSLVIMANYLPNEIVDMIRILGEAGNNYSAAGRLYAERYPNRRHLRKKNHKKTHQESTPGV